MKVLQSKHNHIWIQLIESNRMIYKMYQKYDMTKIGQKLWRQLSPNRKVLLNSWEYIWVRLVKIYLNIYETLHETLIELVDDSIFVEWDDNESSHKSPEAGFFRYTADFSAASRQLLRCHQTMGRHAEKRGWR